MVERDYRLTLYAAVLEASLSHDAAVDYKPLSSLQLLHKTSIAYRLLIDWIVCILHRKVCTHSYSCLLCMK